jgi:RHS repeat-associated protein
VLEELTVSGSTTNLSKVYAYGLDLISQRYNGSEIRYFGYDGHGSTRFLTTDGSILSDTYTYDAYGTLIASSSGTPNNYLYCGEQFDPNLGFNYLRARYLKTDTGRFWTMDEFEGSRSDPPSIHKYLYAQANPVNAADPSGNETLLTISMTHSLQTTLSQVDADHAGEALRTTRAVFGTAQEIEVLLTAKKAYDTYQAITLGIAASRLIIAAGAKIPKIIRAALREISPNWTFIHNQYVKFVRPGALEKSFKTPWGQTRRYDDFDEATKTAFEGNTAPWSTLDPETFSRKMDQIGSDSALLKDPQSGIKRIIWFGTEPLPTTGLGGIIQRALEDAGIHYWVVPLP